MTYKSLVNNSESKIAEDINSLPKKRRTARKTDSDVKNFGNFSNFQDAKPIKKKRLPWSPSDLRHRTTIWLDTSLVKKIKAEAEARRVTQTNIIETTMRDRYSAESIEANEALIARRLTRIDNRIGFISRQLDIIAESTALFVRMWFANTDEIPPEKRDAAVLQAQARYDRYLSSLARTLQAGESIFNDLPKEVVLKPEDFHKP